MKEYLVTGAAGFIGAAVAQKLLDEGHKVVTIDNLTTGIQSSIPKGVIFYKGDCQDRLIIEKLKKHKFEAIYHIAGQSSGEISFDSPVYDLQTNAQSTLQLLQYCIETGCNNFIYASTMSVYGDITESKMPVDESVFPNPKSFYGVGKLASEHYLKIYQQEFNIKTASLRLFNVYGPGQNLKNMRQGMVSIFLAQALKTGNILVKGSKDRYRDFVFIDDVVDAFLFTEKKLYDKPLIINISTGVKTTVEELLQNIQSHLKFNLSIQFEGSTPGDQFGIYGSNNLSQKLIGWQPKHDLDAGINKMVSWALKMSEIN